MGFLLKCTKIKLSILVVPVKTLVKTPKIIAYGFSLSSLPLLERLKASKNVDQVFISEASALAETTAAFIGLFSVESQLINNNADRNIYILFIMRFLFFGQIVF